MPLPDSHPLIISGAPRSGTSLLYNLFDGHNDVAWLVDEGFLFEYLYELGSGGEAVLLDSVPRNVDAVITGLRDKQVMPPVHLPYMQCTARGSVSDVKISAPWDEEAFRAALASRADPGISGLWRWLTLACLSGMGETPKRYACMKSPDYGKSAVAALSTIEETRAIVILRDPLHAIDSLKRSRELRGEKLLTWPLIAKSIRDFQAMRERVAGLSRRNLRILRYESLVSDPEAEMRGIAEWLGIPFDISLLEPTMHGQHWPGISSFKATEGIETSPAERPIRALTSDEQALIRRHLADFRQAFGYE